jgi:hypothetical protein
MFFAFVKFACESSFLLGDYLYAILCFLAVTRFPHEMS